MNAYKETLTTNQALNLLTLPCYRLLVETLGDVELGIAYNQTHYYLKASGGREISVRRWTLDEEPVGYNMAYPDGRVFCAVWKDGYWLNL